jgi:WD40 repeat protein
VALATASALAVAIGKPVATPAARLAEEAAGVTRWSRLKLWGLLVVALGVGIGAAALPSAPTARPNSPASPVGASAKPELRTDQFGDPLPAQALVRIGTIRLRPGHFSGDTAVAISPDNKTIYSAHMHDEVRIWDLATGKEIRAIPAPKNARAIAVSPDGRRLIASGTGEAWAWDIAAAVPQLLWKQKARGLGDQCIAFAPDGRTVACGGAWNTIHLLDAVTGEVQQTLPGRGFKLAFSPDSKTLASSARDGVVRIWDVAASKERLALTCGPERSTHVSSFAFSQDGRTLVTGTKQGAISVWDTASGKECRLADGAHSNTFVAFEADGKAVLEVGDGRIRFRDPTTGRECRDAVTAPNLTANVNWDSCRLSADGKLFVSASSVAIGVWETRTGKAVGPTGVPAGSLMSIAFSPDGQRVALATTSANVGMDGSAAPQVYDSRTGQLLKEFRLPKVDRSPFVFFRPPVRLTSKHLLISAIRNGEEFSSAGYCLTWGDADEPTTQLTEGTKNRWSWSPTPSPDGELLAIPQSENSVVISERVGGKTRHKLNTQSQVTCLAFSSDGGLMVCWEHRQKSAVVTVWEVKTGKKRGGWAIDDEPQEPAPPLALSSDGQRVAIGTDGRAMKGKVRVWDVATGMLLWEFTNAVHPANAVAFSPDGRMLATGGDDGVVRLWETFTGQERLRLPGHRARVWSLAFSPDGLRLASASADSTALIWDTRSSPRSEPNAKPEALWAMLTGADAVVAYRTIFALAESPKTSVPLLRQWLRPTPPAPGQVEKWITELGSENASVRDAATRELTAQGDGVETALRKALKDNPSAELRARLTKLIANFGPVSPWKLGVKRGVESLEWMGADPEARKLLAELAKEPTDTFLNIEAAASYQRLTGPMPVPASP